MKTSGPTVYAERWTLRPVRTEKGYETHIERADHGLIHCGWGIGPHFATLPHPTQEAADALAETWIDGGEMTLHRP